MAGSLRDRLKRSREAFTGKLGRIFGSGSLDPQALEEAEEILLASDLGWELTEKVLEPKRTTSGPMARTSRARRETGRATRATSICPGMR